MIWQRVKDNTACGWGRTCCQLSPVTLQPAGRIRAGTWASDHLWGERKQAGWWEHRLNLFCWHTYWAVRSRFKIITSKLWACFNQGLIVFFHLLSGNNSCPPSENRMVSVSFLCSIFSEFKYSQRATTFFYTKSFKTSISEPQQQNLPSC